VSAARIGVCSWSLRASDPAELAERVRACGLAHVQLALDPLRAAREPGRARGSTGAWETARTRDALAAAGVTVLSGMMGMRGEDYSSPATIRATGGLRPARHWPANLAAARANAAVARELGVGLVSFHAGFLPHDPADRERSVLVERLRAVADAFAEEGVAVALETGQESAETLLGVLAELGHDWVGVNFDPANLLLYDVDEPVAALAALAPWVRQIHVKDALRPRTPGAWGSEVPAGTGAVDWRAFFAVVRERGIDVDLVIEREAGDDRVADVRAARPLLTALVDEVPG
jgi:sugar phosphate isomerase/epimerase